MARINSRLSPPPAALPAQATQSSFLTPWPLGLTRPIVSTINFTQNDPALAKRRDGRSVDQRADLSVYNSGNVHVILDVTGYYQ
jgi:hypothetical protein